MRPLGQRAADLRKRRAWGTPPSGGDRRRPTSTDRFTGACGGVETIHPKDLDVSDATPPAGFGRPDLTAFARLDGLGLSVTGQRLEPDRAVLACRVVEPDQWCRRCGSEGAARDTVIRRLAHEPLGWRPTVLEVVVRRYRCADCGHVWRQDTSAAAEPRASSRAPGCGGRWKGSWSHTSPSPVSPRDSGSRGTPPTTRSWLKASGC